MKTTVKKSREQLHAEVQLEINSGRINNTPKLKKHPFDVILLKNAKKCATTFQNRRIR